MDPSAAEPTPAQAHYELGLQALQRAGPAAALPHLQAAVAAEPGQMRYWVGFIEALIQAGQPALADDVLQQARAAGLPVSDAQLLAVRISVGDAPEPEELQTLMALFNSRDFVQLERAAGVMVRRYADSGPIWNLLGMARLMTGRAAEALAPLQNAAVHLPQDADVLVNLANALRAQGRLAEAEANLLRAQQIAPESAALHGSLGNVYRMQRRLDAARDSYARALQLQPNLAGARQNLGVVCGEQGDLPQAEAHYRAALAMQPDLLDGYVNLATLLQNTGRVREAQDVLAQGLRAVTAGHWMLASLALTGCWLLRDSANAQHLFKAFQEAAASEDALRTDRPLREYFWLSARLFDAMARQPQAYAAAAEPPLLHVLGESHALAPAHAVFGWIDGPVRGASRLVKGVKMHHLAQPAANGYQAAMKVQLDALLPESHLLLTIGEIDCRPDEGLWAAQQKGKGSLAQLVQTTVDGYLNWVQREVGARSLRTLTLQGVPAPTQATAERDAFLAMVAEVNAQLRAGCAARGWHFLDVHAATADAAGAGNGVWHLDEVHLKPGFYGQAAGYLRGP